MQAFRLMPLRSALPCRFLGNCDIAGSAAKRSRCVQTYSGADANQMNMWLWAQDGAPLPLARPALAIPIRHDAARVPVFARSARV